MNSFNIKNIDVKDIDLNKAFLHYTNIKNLKSISNKGLIPKVGINSKGIEKNKKIFFTEGVESALIIMDIWINWLILKPKSKYIYWLGAYFLEKKYFPKKIYIYLFESWRNNKSKFKYACKKLDKILNESIYLVLDLEKNVDFDYNDIDEVKNGNFPEEILKYFYDKRSNINSKTIEKWNMHTYINKTISLEKISVLKYNYAYSVKKILIYFIEENIEFVKLNCKLLYEYYKIYK